MSGEVFVMKTGGFASLFTVIEVTYPSGSICTCGGKAAKDTSGHALFPVKAGTYTVECHTSDNSKSKSTSITVAESDKGKCKSVTLSYELYIFKAGTGSNTTWTTGAGTYGTSWNTSGTDCLIQAIGGFNGYVTLAYLYADSAFDVTNYTTLVVTGYGNSDQTFGVSYSKGGSLAASSTFTSSSSETTYNVDITRISGNAYFVISSKGSYITNTQFTITNIYFK